ncbi:MAG: Holliday junction resolvase RuvX [Rhodothermales bacterium]|nr:Holliday junction resolvase RuvX [Rhodothermales bacterium]MBO6781393.1 Holliday junction resolvase RuvX [Rhodothermales bacterium]
MNSSSARNAPAGSGPAARVLGVDVGNKRVGVAKADPLRMFAQPVGTFDPNTALERIRLIHESDGVETVVVGWPLTEKGSEGPATRMVNTYVRRIRKAVPGVHIVRLDERYTSEEARDRLRTSRSGVPVDTIAAGIILQEYLDRN